MTHKQLTWLSRVLFFSWFIDELFCSHHRNDPEATSLKTDELLRASAMVVPLVWATRIPRPLRYLGIALQTISLIVMVGARRQLIKANSFGWSVQAGTQPQRNGWYTLLEHPIYLSMLTHLIGWSATNPISGLAILLIYRYFGSYITAERAHLARLGTMHRGLDSGLWDRLCKEHNPPIVPIDHD